MERTYDFVVACKELQRKISNVDVVEDFDSRPHKTRQVMV